MKKHIINNQNTAQWKDDVQKSVMFYNEWFLKFAPTTYINARLDAFAKVDRVFQNTECLNVISSDMLKTVPESMTILRMSTTPPLAQDRLAGLADVPKTLIKALEKGHLPTKMDKVILDELLDRILSVINQLFDVDVMPWLTTKSIPDELNRLLALHVIADRVCGSLADPIIRNEQERRQLNSINDYLTGLGYKYIDTKDIHDFKRMEAGTFSYHLNIPVNVNSTQKVKMPIDVVIMRKNSQKGELPLFIECKSAGDFTNTNKRRKEEATKIGQLKNTYGKDVVFILFLCGYFDSGYLGYEAAEGIDWIWEHRIEDFDKIGI